MMRQQRIWIVAAFAIGVLIVALLGASLPGRFSIWDWETLKNLGSIGAVLISLSALIATLWTGHAKTVRERREELRQSIEKLIDLRNEVNTKLATLANEAEREMFSSMMNTKKSIYLASAEDLARRTPHVTSAEWSVLGTEYLFESNFAKAEALYKLALDAAGQSSLTTRVSALRALAEAQMRQGQAGLVRGRHSFEEATRLIAGQDDPYSGYAAVLTYRIWSGAEYGSGHLVEAHDKLKRALQIAGRLPDWFYYKQTELRHGAQMLIALADSFKAANDLPTSRACLTDSIATLQPFIDDFSRAISGDAQARLAALEPAVSNAATALTNIGSLTPGSLAAAALLARLKSFPPPATG